MTIFNYTVNYLDVAVVAVFLLLAVIGCRRGLVLNVVRFVRFSVGMFLCFYLSENLAKPIYDGYVRQRALDYINENIVTGSNLDVTMENLNAFASQQPKFIGDYLKVDSLIMTSEDISQTILENIFEPMLLFLIKAAVFIAVFAVFFGITGLLILYFVRRSKKKEEKRGKKSALKKTDMAFGLVVGLLKACVLVFAFTSVVYYLLAVNEDKELSAFLTQAQNSTLLQYINEINPFNAITEGFI